MNGSVDGGWMDEGLDEWLRMDRWVSGWMDGWMLGE